MRGPGVVVEGTGAAGVTAIRGGGLPVSPGPHPSGVRVLSAVLTPIGFERSLDLEGVKVVERVVPAPAAGVCFFEWAADREVEMTVAWVVAGGGGGGVPQWHVDGHLLTVEEAAARVLISFSEPISVDARAREGDDPGLSFLVTAAPAQGNPFRLAVVSLGADEAVGPVLRVMGRSHIAVPSRRAAVDRALEQGLRLDASEPEPGRALAWASAELAVGAPLGKRRRQSSGTARSGRPDGAARPGVDVAERAGAALALGDRGLARAVVRGFDGESADGHDLRLVARYHAWTGDLAMVKDIWPDVRDAAERLLGAGRSAPEAVLGGRVEELCRDLGVIAEDMGDEALATRLRESGSLGAGTDAGTDSGAASAAGAASIDIPEAECAASSLVDAVVRGLLGVEPDAARGRVVLRPRLPEAWTWCDVRRLTVGDASIDLEYVREGDRHSYTLLQTRGGPPVTLIFEPELAGGAVRGAAVDGEPAALEAVRVGGRLRVPVQVVLDGERRVEVEIERRDH